MLHTNVIYLTTRCNLDCSYCYERQNRLEPSFLHKDVTKEEVHDFINEIVDREADGVSTIVIYGGEPLLKIDMVEEIINYGLEKKAGKVAFNMKTNATLINDKNVLLLKDLYDKAEMMGSIFSICISYDGSGHSERKYSNGKPSSDDVLKSIDLLKNNNIPYVISYTVHKGNHDVIISDILSILIKYTPKKILIRYAEEDLYNSGVEYSKLKDSIFQKFLYIYEKYKISICDEVCCVCGECNKDIFDKNNYLIPAIGTHKSTKEPIPETFDHFIKK